jgi:group I intron endonuclease
VTRKWLSLQSDNRVKKIGIRNYSTQEDTTNVIGRESNTADIKPVKYYEDIYTMKPQILKENKNKSGIYKFVNKLSGSFYIGSAKNLRTLIYSYLQLSILLKGKNNSIITRALIKYGYSNFSLEILEYCDVSKLLEREQYYFDLLEPDYNIAKVAGYTIGIPRSEEFKNKLSELRKGKVHKEETKLLMSQIHLGANNSMFGKKHTDQTKELIRLSKVGKVLDTKTKNTISASNGTPIFLYALCSDCSTDKYCLVKQFVSFREAGKYLNMSHSNVSRYLKSGNLISRRDGKYKLTISSLEN